MQNAQASSHNHIRWGAGICHPVPLGAALITAMNDHWLKSANIFPEFFTGKLSDFAGLFFFPLLLVSIVYGIGALVQMNFKWSRALHVSVCLSVAILFTLMNVSVVWNDLMAFLGFYKVMDTTDLFALPVLVLSWLFMERKYAS